MNKREGIIAIVLCLIVLSGLSMASYNKYNENLRTQYYAGESISGTINMSFTNEFVDTNFTSNFAGSIGLLGLLKANGLLENVDYTCDYAHCSNHYTAGDEITSSPLSEGTPIYVGFKIPSGTGVDISSLKFSINSDAGEMCSAAPPLIVDILDGDLAFIQSVNNSRKICDNEFTGCFDFDITPETQIIGNSLYCENITLEPAPAYWIGAMIKNSTENHDLWMRLEGSDGPHECKINKTFQTSSEFEELGCIANYSLSKSGGYLVCVYSNADDSGYEMRAEQQSSKHKTCGTSNGELPYNIDFDIRAKPIEFGAVGTLNVNESSFDEQNVQSGLIDYANTYISDNYQKNCTKGCILPFKISGATQNLDFTNARITYTRDGISGETPISDLNSLTPGKSRLTTTRAVNLEMSYADFKIPINYTGKSLVIKYNDVTQFTKTINVTPSFGFSINPTSILFGAKTNFQITGTTANITYSTWDFGDGTPAKVSFERVISHRYTNYMPAGYKVKVSVLSSDGKNASNTFNVFVKSLNQSANQLVSEYSALIGNLSTSINSFASFSSLVSKELGMRFNVTSMQSALNATKKMLANATNDSAYLDVIASALSIDPPEALDFSERGNSIPLEFGFGTMNVDPIISLSYNEQASGASASIKEDLKKAIAAWFAKNYEANVDYGVVAKEKDNGETPILTDFKISLTKKLGADESANEAYFVINYPISLITFGGNYSQKQIGPATYMPITDSISTIEFLVNDTEVNNIIGIATLGMYISPKVDALGAFSMVPVVLPAGFNWGRFLLWTGILLVVALILYALLQQWYKKRYENYLFKNPVDLYNVINFIHNSRKNGLNDGEIGEKLRKAKWNSEQIAYAFRKLDGKRTGMPELPFFGFFEKKKIMAEIEKRKQQQTGQL